jgi:hypothetical protein
MTVTQSPSAALPSFGKTVGLALDDRKIGNGIVML